MDVRLAVLGQLARLPTTGYDLARMFAESRLHASADIRSGSVYHALQRLAAEGLIEPDGRTPSGAGSDGRRGGVVYRITGPGRAELQRLLGEVWRGRPIAHPAELYLAIAYWDELPRHAVLAAIEDQLRELRHRANDWELAAEPLQCSDERLRLAFRDGAEHLRGLAKLLERLRDLPPRPGPGARPGGKGPRDAQDQ